MFSGVDLNPADSRPTTNGYGYDGRPIDALKTRDCAFQATTTSRYDPLGNSRRSEGIVGPNSGAQLYGLVVTTKDGNQYMPITRVKNQAQADVLGLKVGGIIPIMVPQNGADIMSNLMTQAGKLNITDTSAFKNMWRNTPDNPNNFKLSLQPTSLYDQFGNFAYGATAESVGYPLWFTQWAGAYGRNGSLTGNNLPINQRDISSGYNAARAGGTYSVARVDFGGPGP